MKRFKKPFVGKKYFKNIYKFCQICHEENYSLLDVHRIVPGEEGGKYEHGNCVCLCVSCHRKHHSKLINIKGWFSSTAGKLLLYIDENKEEKFI